MTVRELGISLVVTTALCAIVVKAQDGAQLGNTDNAVAQLLSLRPTVRESASDKIFQEQGKLQKALLANLNTLSQKPPQELREFGGPFHTTVNLLGHLRVESAVGYLLPLVDFQLDAATAPIGFNVNPVDMHPVATALSRIGGRSVIEGTMERLRLPVNDQTLRASAWVLKQSLGSEVATALVQQRINGVNAALKKSGQQTNDEKANFEKVRQLLKGREPILLLPAATNDLPAATNG